MKPTYTIVPLVLCLILSSCSTPTITVAPPTKKTPFYIEVQSTGKKQESYTVEKSARLTAGSSLVISAESAGEVTDITIKEGQKVKKGTRLVSLKDTINSYDIRLEQAENTLNIQDKSVDATELSLDKAIADTEIAYEQAKRTYDTIIAKNPLAYDTLVNSNQKTLDNLDTNYKLYLADALKNLDQILYQSDQILGLSTVFENTNNNFEAQLGARVGSLKVESDNSWGVASAMLGQLKAKQLKPITPESAQADIEMIEQAYKVIRKHVDDMIYMLQNNVISGSLSQEMNNGWLAIYSGYRSSIQGSDTAFSAWKLQTLTFLKNYKINELAVKVAIESLTRELTPQEKDLINNSADARLLYNTNIIDLKDRIKSAELSLKQAENARNVALKNKGITLAQMEANRKSSELTLEQTKREYSKLTIAAPFDGTITKVITSVGQRTNIGTPMIEIVSNIPEVNIDLESSLSSNLNIGDSLQVQIGEKSYTGTISALSRAANANLLYTTRISVPGANSLLGSAASIIFTLSREAKNTSTDDTIILPLTSIKIISEQEGEVALLGSGNTIEYKSVRLGKIRGTSIEVLDRIETGALIIISDVQNYDKNKHILEVKKT